MSLLDNLKLKEVINENEPYNSSFVFNNLHPGTGVTLGNFLRRNLMQFISGVSPFAVSISDKNGVANVELGTLEGVTEVTAYLILNLKKIILERDKKKSGIFCLELSIKNKENKERIITANDFQKENDVEIKNPELYLATLAPLSSLEIKLYFRRGWDYHQFKDESEEHNNYFDKKKDVIFFDTDYSPIKGGMVNYTVDTNVSGLNKRDETMTLTINSNGTIKPKEALLEVLDMWQRLFNNIIKSEKINH